MTGFARVTHGTIDLDLDIEVRSVNHRFLDLSLKGPRCYAKFERDFKGVFQKTHRRGRIDVSVTRHARGAYQQSLAVRSESFERSVKSYTSACKTYGVGTEGLSSFIGQLILREQGAVDQEIEPSEGEVIHLFEALEQASQALAVMREREGEALVADLTRRLARVNEYKEQLASRAQVTPQRLKEILEGRLRALLPDIKADPQRLALEVALLADRIDVSEELVRLEAHLRLFGTTLCGEIDGVGRKLDFVTQEIGRELNTIGSKAQDAQMQAVVVEAKAELERIREQVQNVE
jgi:uncharacterized protein (TIGR00255 family)